MRIENSFIPVDGIGRRRERRLWRDGITDWDRFRPETLGPTLGRRVSRFIATAKEHLDRNDSTFFAGTFPERTHWRLYENFRDETCFLDIETTGLDFGRHEVTVVSLHQNGATTTLVRGDDLTRETLRARVDEAALLVTFNGKRFDIPFLESSFDLEFDRPHLDLLYPSRRIGLTGGLKAIERHLGIDRDEPDIGGRDAVRLWHAYERGDDAALETLVSYNRDDTVNLGRLADDVCSRLHHDVFEAVVSEGQQPLFR